MYIQTALAVVQGVKTVSDMTDGSGGNKNGGAGAQSQTSTRDPWAAAQPFMKRNLQTNQDLQDYYAKNPFSQLQQQQYQGLFNTLANNQAGGNALLANASTFGKSKGGLLGPMQAMPTGTQAAPIDWAGMNPYNSQGMKDSAIKQSAPTTYQAGQSGDPIWEEILGGYNKLSTERFGRPMDRAWDSDSGAQDTYQKLVDQYLAKKNATNGLLGG